MAKRGRSKKAKSEDKQTLDPGDSMLVPYDKADEMKFAFRVKRHNQPNGVRFRREKDDD